MSDFGVKAKHHFEFAEIADAVLDFDFLFVHVEAEVFECVAYHFACDRTEHFAIVFAAFRADFDGDFFKFVCKLSCFLALGGNLCFVGFFALLRNVDILLRAFLRKPFFDEEIASVTVVYFDDLSFLPVPLTSLRRMTFISVSL